MTTRFFWKRGLDIFLSSLSLLILIIPLFLLACIIRIKLGSPIFLVQTRPGLNGKPFRILKFRTMLDIFEEDGTLAEDSKRMTSFGSFLRSASLDELPELWNVLKGEMSLVGPRPLLMEYLPEYNARQRRRHEVRPGITGWAQINGRNAISWQERLEMDVWYVENISVLLDLQILVKTFLKVVTRSGIQAEGHVTMPKFKAAGRIEEL